MRNDENANGNANHILLNTPNAKRRKLAVDTDIDEEFKESNVHLADNTAAILNALPSLENIPPNPSSITKISSAMEYDCIDKYQDKNKEKHSKYVYILKDEKYDQSKQNPKITLKYRFDKSKLLKIINKSWMRNARKYLLQEILSKVFGNQEVCLCL